MNNIEERLKACFQAVFADLSEEEIFRASATSLSAWDSLASITLISLVEEEFRLTISLEDYQSFISFALIADLIRSQVVDNAT